MTNIINDYLNETMNILYSREFVYAFFIWVNKSMIEIII